MNILFNFLYKKCNVNNNHNSWSIHSKSFNLYMMVEIGVQSVSMPDWSLVA